MSDTVLNTLHVLMHLFLMTTPWGTEGKLCTERLPYLPKVAQPVSNRTGISKSGIQLLNSLDHNWAAVVGSASIPFTSIYCRHPVNQVSNHFPTFAFVQAIHGQIHVSQPPGCGDMYNGEEFCAWNLFLFSTFLTHILLTIQFSHLKICQDLSLLWAFQSWEIARYK